MDYESLLKDSWNPLKENIVTYIVALLIAVVGSILIVTIAPLAYGIGYMAVKGARKEAVEINDVFVGFKSENFLRSWIYVIIYAVIIAVANSIHSIVGTVVGILFIFALPLLVIRGYGGVDALKESFELVKDNPFESLIIYVINFVLIFIGILLLGIGVLVTAPLGQIFVANATFDLIGDRNASSPEQFVDLSGEEDDSSKWTVE
ncbi:glycerophosphoryl diester phosphodiesterase membrane domain-containing protein [Methanolobus sp. ZRKC3]|uniref:glycerophosphoryl diester phosphodiesterase membrane domain-containing protein n=1 Tax=Methanolobus sp. ZRKC3 TaxID=3125786 RepID=UPI00324C6010